MEKNEVYTAWLTVSVCHIKAKEAVEIVISDCAQAGLEAYTKASQSSNFFSAGL